MSNDTIIQKFKSILVSCLTTYSIHSFCSSGIKRINRVVVFLYYLISPYQCILVSDTYKKFIGLINMFVYNMSI